MTIDRLTSAGVPAPDPRKAGPATRGEHVAGTPGTSGSGPVSRTEPSDQISLSPDALDAGSTESVPRGELPAARLRQIGERIASGFYDRDQVIDLVAKAVAAEVRASENPSR